MSRADAALLTGLPLQKIVRVEKFEFRAHAMRLYK